MSITHQTPILDNKYTVRTVAEMEAGKQYVTVYVTNNDNGLTLGGKNTKKEYAGSVQDMHIAEVANSIGILGSGIRWEPRVNEGETTVVTK